MAVNEFKILENDPADSVHVYRGLDGRFHVGVGWRKTPTHHSVFTITLEAFDAIAAEVARQRPDQYRGDPEGDLRGPGPHRR